MAVSPVMWFTCFFQYNFYCWYSLCQTLVVATLGTPLASFTVIKNNVNRVCKKFEYITKLPFWSYFFSHRGFDLGKIDCIKLKRYSRQVAPWCVRGLWAGRTGASQTPRRGCPSPSPSPAAAAYRLLLLLPVVLHLMAYNQNTVPLGNNFPVIPEYSKIVHEYY